MHYTIKEAADRLKMSTAWLRKKIFTGELRHMKIGRRVFIPESVLEEILTHSVVEPRKKQAPHTTEREPKKTVFLSQSDELTPASRPLCSIPFGWYPVSDDGQSSWLQAEGIHPILRGGLIIRRRRNRPWQKSLLI